MKIQKNNVQFMSIEEIRKKHNQLVVSQLRTLGVGLFLCALISVYFIFRGAEMNVFMNPLSVDKTVYEPCENIKVDFRRDTAFSLKGEFTLFYMDADFIPSKQDDYFNGFTVSPELQKNKRGFIEGYPLQLEPGEGVNVEVVYTLPCNMPQGEWRLMCTYNYDLLVYKKNSICYTKPFTVIN